MEVEINPAQRTRPVVLAEDDRHKFIQGDAVAKLTAIAVSFDGLGHEGNQARLKLIRRLVDANHVFVIRPQRLGDLRLKRFYSHRLKIVRIAQK